MSLVCPHHWRSLGPGPHLSGRKSAVDIEAEDGIGADVVIREESIAGLWWGEGAEGIST